MKNNSSSLIITCHNQHKYLNQLLFVLNLFPNKLLNTEILIVDSSDEKFKLNSEIKINYFQIQNNGPSAARNFGSKHATGDWLVFCDADDFVNPFVFEFLKKNRNYNRKIFLFNYVRNLDIEIEMRVKDFYNSLNGKKSQNIIIEEKKIKSPIHFLKQFYPVHSVAYKKELFIDNNFDENQWFIEDVNFNLQLLSNKLNEFSKIECHDFTSFHRDFTEKKSLSQSNDLHFWEGVCKNYNYVLHNYALSKVEKIKLTLHVISTLHTVPFEFKKIIRVECNLIFKQTPLLFYCLKNRRFYFSILLLRRTFRK
jgi:glycosyltransferase involved in cell wall biosynthesis